MKLPSPLDLWSSLLRERLLLTNAGAEREGVWREEKLLQRRRADLPLLCLLAWSLLKLPEDLLPLPAESPPLPRLWLLLAPTLVLDTLFAACFPPLGKDDVEAGGSFMRKKTT